MNHERDMRTFGIRLMQLDAQTKQRFDNFDDYTILCYYPGDLDMPLVGVAVAFEVAVATRKSIVLLATLLS